MKVCEQKKTQTKWSLRNCQKKEINSTKKCLKTNGARTNGIKMGICHSKTLKLQSAGLRRE